MTLKRSSGWLAYTSGWLAYTLIIAAAFAGTASAVTTDIPDLDLSWYETAATEPVSVFTVPDGQGSRFDAAFAYGGVVMDATITLYLVNGDGAPIPGFAAEDMWLGTTMDGLAPCQYGPIADADTDANGMTQWQEPLEAGGYTDPDNELTVVIVNGDALLGPGLDVYFNSPDLSGDGFVDITDIAMFSQDFFGAYSYRSDFNWDGSINLSDISYMTALGLGAECP